MIYVHVHQQKIIKVFVLVRFEIVLNFDFVLSVTKVIVPVENTREYIVEQYTLNKNQKAAFMIITGHLDGLDRLNEGMSM